MSSMFWWDLTRASGLTAWAFLTLTLVWGTLVAGKLATWKGARRWLLDLHPYLGGLGLAAMALHITAAVADPWVKIGWIAAVVPFASGWRPVGVALGALAVWLLGAVELTSLARRRLSRETWHRIHLLSYGAAWLVTIHAIAVGTDLHNRLVAWAAAGMVVAASGVSAMRALREPPPPAAPRKGHLPGGPATAMASASSSHAGPGAGPSMSQVAPARS